MGHLNASETTCLTLTGPRHQWHTTFAAGHRH